MPLSTQSENQTSGADAAPNPVAVREQLKRLLAHPLFTHSKRYPVLLAYVVEQALAGNAGELKERTIGVEAFGREPSYDVNLDPVVRMTAAEVRRRLSQYYYNAEHAGELVVELPVGSYVPLFREPAVAQTGGTSEAVPAGKSEVSAETPAAAVAAELSSARGRSGSWRWPAITIALLIAALAGYGVGRGTFFRRPSDIERFWKPITASSSRVTYCLGEPISVSDPERASREGKRLYGSLDVADVVTLARSIEPLVPRNGEFRIVAASETEFAQLREGPVVLIGAFDNVWTMRVTQDLPFGFERDSTGRKIVDRKSGQNRAWRVQAPVAPDKLTEDYAIVARIQDKMTGQPMIILAGILREGTEAAGEVVSNPVYLESLLEKAPKDWDGRNMEAVIETHVIDGHPGPPTIVAVETW